MKGFLHEWTIYDNSQNAFEDLFVFKGHKGKIDPITKEEINNRQEDTIRGCVGNFDSIKNETNGVFAVGSQICTLVTDRDNLINWCFIKNGYVWEIKEKKPSNTDENYYFEYICGRGVKTDENPEITDFERVEYD